MGGATEDGSSDVSEGVAIGEARIGTDLGQMAYAIGPTLNEKADRLCGAKWCERRENRRVTDLGSNEMLLHDHTVAIVHRRFLGLQGDSKCANPSVIQRAALDQLSKNELTRLALYLQRPEKASRMPFNQPLTDKQSTRENARPGSVEAEYEPRNRNLCGGRAVVRRLPQIGFSTRAMNALTVHCSAPFGSSDAVVHQLGGFRAAHMVEDGIDGHALDVLASDRYSARRSHGMRKSTCLAHPVNDAVCTIGAGIERSAVSLLTMTRTAVGLAPAAPARKRRKLEKHLARIPDAISFSDPAKNLKAKVQGGQDKPHVDHRGPSHRANHNRYSIPKRMQCLQHASQYAHLKPPYNRCVITNWLIVPEGFRQ
ncbi:hypothetical protein [Brucella intermedia]|uniref:hypothetical protein n=1 Tax=Brucella intermedia TaxID=94625 RepID=UPI00235F292F|nr:hypothetical protein [Brucella intermedia]